MGLESSLPRLLPQLPGLVVLSDVHGGLRWMMGEVAGALAVAPGPTDDLGGLFTRPAAIFLESHLWPLLRREGRIDACYAALALADGGQWPCFVSARTVQEDAERLVLWSFFPAHERARFEAELIKAREKAQHLAAELAEANHRLKVQANTLHRHNRELDALAQTDPLTGLGNRRALQAAFDAWLQHEAIEAGTGPGALLMVDADHFKAVNDAWGHEAGDQVLVRIANKLRASIRHSDCAARLGGEEFALWLPGANADAARRVADDIHRRVLNLRLAPDQPALTVSIGVALLAGPKGSTDLATLLRRADEAVYAAKSAGRSRTCWADGDPPRSD